MKPHLEIHPDGSIRWYQNGKLHREDGPAVEHINGSKAWYIYGKLHRIYGPAIEHGNTNKRWFISGIEYAEAEYKKQMRSYKIKEILHTK